MQDLEIHIQRVNRKLQELLKKHSALQKDNDLCKKQLQQLEEKNALQLLKIETLEQQQHILRSAAGNMNEPDKKAFEQLLNKYIRSIDQCINYLNE